MKLSVALCTYNGDKFLADQLESIFWQTKPIQEVIICDDRSTDNTSDVVKEFDEKYPGVIKLFVNQTNLGGKRNFEKAFSLTTGDIIFFCDQDDTWEPHKVEATLLAFSTDANALGIFSDGFLMDEHGKRLAESFWDSLHFTKEERQNLQPSEICFYIINYVNMVAGSMLAVRKEAKELILPFRFLDKIWHDQFIALVLSSLNRLAFVNSKLINYRQHRDQQIGAGTEEFKRLVSSFKNFVQVSYQQKWSLLYFNHCWNTYEKVKMFANYYPSFEPQVSFYQKRAWDGRRSLLQHHSFFGKKARLLKWFFKGQFETSFWHVLSL